MRVNELLETAIKYRASDIHLTCGVPPILRIDGRLIKLDNTSDLVPEETERIARELMNQRNLAMFEERGEVDFAHSIEDVGRFRINVFRQRGSVCLVLRIVPLVIPSFESLELPSILKELALKKRGLILVTGPTGSGKSTTLAAMVDYINTNRNSHILTLEDPVEYVHEHNKSIVNQRELGQDTNSYAVAIRAALRQDPDTMLIGEMRDLETISTAITAAETGHLVLSTLHTMGAVSTIDRIIDVFPSDQQQQIRVQLSSTLVAVISQQLLQNAEGPGRVAAFEIMLCNAAIKSNIREGKTHHIMNVIQTNRDSGMVSMDYCLAKLYKEKKVTYEEALSHAIDKDSLAKLL